MKEVSTEIASPQPVAVTAPQDLTVSPVQSAALAAPEPSQAVTKIETQPQKAVQSGPQTTQAASMMADFETIDTANADIFNPTTPTASAQPQPLELQPLQPQLQQPSIQNSQLALLPTDQVGPAPIGGINSPDGFAIGTGGEPFVDPLEAAAESRIPILYANMIHGQCKSGWGPKPRKVNATNITPGDPYYIEIRMRHTPLLPVGHTYVAYGRLSPTGQILDEKLIMLAPFGGYAGAALASGIPMPGVLDPHPDDCRIRPKAAYRVSLNAQRYEKLLLDVQKARSEKPSYLLFAFNCNHFASRIAASVGIKPPANIYVPALEYIYAMIDANEGGKIARN